MKALEVYVLSAKHWQHPDLREARKYPSENFAAFICNLNQHWFDIRVLAYCTLTNKYDYQLKLYFENYGLLLDRLFFDENVFYWDNQNR